MVQGLNLPYRSFLTAMCFEKSNKLFRRSFALQLTIEAKMKITHILYLTERGLKNSLQ